MFNFIRLMLYNHGMDFMIRSMQVKDLPSLAAWMVETPLWQRYGLTVEAAIANFENSMARGDWLIVAEDKASVCGFAWVMPKDVFGRSPYLRLIGVRADKTGSGIGTALMNEVERQSATVANELFLLVSDFNVSAQAFYKQRGYTQIGAVEAYVVPDITELIFYKRLK
jgi:ribosomal protein S18 acetylase RimI-like enzyme